MFPSNIIQLNGLVKVKLSYVLNIVLVYFFVAYNENIKKARENSRAFLRALDTLSGFCRSLPGEACRYFHSRGYRSAAGCHYYPWFFLASAFDRSDCRYYLFPFGFGVESG